MAVVAWVAWMIVSWRAAPPVFQAAVVAGAGIDTTVNIVEVVGAKSSVDVVLNITDAADSIAGVNATGLLERCAGGSGDWQ